MLRGLYKLIFLGVAVLIGGAGIVLYRNHTAPQRQIQELEAKNQVLQQAIARLSTERRIAEIVVLDQQIIDGQQHTTVLFVEYARDGSNLPAKSFTVKGKMVHLDAMVIKFDSELVASGDPLRGHSICLFTRMYGDAEAPESGHRLDEPGKIPLIYRGADPRISEVEQELWANFWKLASDEAYRSSQGVRLANGQGVWGPLEPDKLYVVTIESDGGVNRIEQPLNAISREMIRRKGTNP